jgi:hypothetical protein
MMAIGRVLAFATAVGLTAWGLGAHSAQIGEKTTFFKTQVVPILEGHCVVCHNQEKSSGGLDLSSRAGLMKGGDDGPAIIAGEPAKSTLWQMISGAIPKMPRKSTPLSAEQVAAIEGWIKDGAAWPADQTLAARGEGGTKRDDWWSVQPLDRPVPPAVKNQGWVRNPIDAFVLAAQEEHGLAPAPAADRVTYIRRLSYDLLGLPPTPEEIDAFVGDLAEDAFERLVDRLLASPQYGERWARFWLDLIHYADTHGFDKDKRRLWAWLFRDWVIQAAQRDLGYRRFIRYQLAGDVFFPDDPDGVIATGFVAAGPWDFVGHVELREGTVEKEKTRLLDRDDMVMTTMSTFVSQTVHCARCHDHKFDPISQRDYYRLQAVFAGVERGDRAVPARGPDEIGKGKGRTVYGIVPIAARPIHVLSRGDVESKQAAVNPGALSVMAGLTGELQVADLKKEGQRRAALADWIADDRNVLTWRSIANRVWQFHFGRGLVETPSDFGRNGARPSHAALLDWLAWEIRRHDSIKQLHRQIVLSSTYRQSVNHNAAHAKIDADNRFLWRMNRQRLDAEAIRDAVLMVSGKLNLKAGGPGFELFKFKDDHSPVYDHLAVERVHDPATWRRTIYRVVVRSVPNPFLDALDCADPNVNVPVRNTTLTALQALAMMNNPLMVKQAEFFAERLKGQSNEPGLQIDQAYRLALGRLPSASERGEMLAYVQKHGLANACRLLFNTNEFVFVD